MSVCTTCSAAIALMLEQLKSDNQSKAMRVLQPFRIPLHIVKSTVSNLLAVHLQ